LLEARKYDRIRLEGLVDARLRHDVKVAFASDGAHRELLEGLLSSRADMVRLDAEAIDAPIYCHLVDGINLILRPRIIAMLPMRQMSQEWLSELASYL
jgi:hypothetical protein